MPTSETRLYTALFSTTLDDHRPEMVDNVHNSIPLLWFLRNMGRGRDYGDGRGIRMQNGGARIKIPVVLSKNPNSRSYSAYETLTVTATDEITVAIEDMKNVATAVGISGPEMDQNQGEAEKIDLLRAKVDLAEMGLQEEINKQLVQGIVGVTGTNPTRRFENGNANKDMLPLGYLIQKDFASAGVLVHGINQFVEVNWRNQTYSPGGTASTAASGTDFLMEMSNLYNRTTKGSSTDPSDLIYCDQNYFEILEAVMMHRQRFGSFEDERAASVGFQSIKFKNATVLWDQFVPNFGNNDTDAVSLTQNPAQAVAFFINTRWYELVLSRNVNFKNTPFVEPYDQDAIWSKILVRGNATIKQRRKHGLHFGVDAAGINATT